MILATFCKYIKDKSGEMGKYPQEQHVAVYPHSLGEGICQESQPEQISLQQLNATSV